MRRREFIMIVGSAAAGWPLTARAQQSGKVPRIGFLGLSSASSLARRLESFRQGLHDFGYIEGTNITIEYRWAEGHYDRLPELADEIVASSLRRAMSAFGTKRASQPCSAMSAFPGKEGISSTGLDVLLFRPVQLNWRG